MPQKRKKKTRSHFDRVFQRKLISLILAKQPSYPIIDLVSENLFESKAHQIIVQAYLQLSKEYEIINLRMIKHFIRQRKTLDGGEKSLIVRELQELSTRTVSSDDRAYLESEITKYVSYTRVVAVLRDDAVNLLEANKLDVLHSKLEKAFAPPTAYSSGLEYFGSLQMRMQERYKTVPVVRTLIPPLDHHLRGHGANIGALCVVLGATGSGKSMMLTYLTKAAVMQKKNVLFITLQLLENDIAWRLDSSFTGITLRDALERTEDISDKLFKTRERYGNSVVIKFFPAMQLTVSKLHMYIKKERDRGFHPDVVIIDYGDLMVGDSGVDPSAGRYYESGGVFDGLLGLAQSENLLIWTASQASKGVNDKGLLTIDKVAESYRKVMAAPLVVSINRTPEEKVENKARLYIAKNSHGRDDIVCPIDTGYDRGLFYCVEKEL